MIHKTELTEQHWETFKHAFANYVVKGRLPGHFLTAVLENDLLEAVCRADNTSAGLLKALVKLLWNEMPRDCHGSAKKVSAWTGIERAELRATYEFRILSAELTQYDEVSK